MNTPKHTPGPWRVIEHADGTKSVVDQSGENACTKANAALISSATELLEALREVLEWLESAQADEPKDYHNEHLEAAISKARAAIAKAEGRE